MPTAITPSLERWAGDIHVVVREASWNVSLVSVPEAFDDEGQVPVVGTTVTLIGKFESPYKGARTTALLRTGSSSQTLPVPASNDGVAFVAFTVPWPGRNELGSGYEDRNGLKFASALLPGLPELRKALSAVPMLRVALGEHIIDAWHAPYELPEALTYEEPPEITIRPDLEGLRLGLHWRGAENSGSEEGLTAEATKGRLRGFWGMDAEVRISGGALGNVILVFHAARKATPGKTDSRKLRWASLAKGEHGESGGAWMLRRSAALDPRLLRVTQTCSCGRWMPLVISTVRESKRLMPRKGLPA